MLWRTTPAYVVDNTKKPVTHNTSSPTTHVMSGCCPQHIPTIYVRCPQHMYTHKLCTSQHVLVLHNTHPQHIRRCPQHVPHRENSDVPTLYAHTIYIVWTTCHIWCGRLSSTPYSSPHYIFKGSVSTPYVTCCPHYIQMFSTLYTHTIYYPVWNRHPHTISKILHTI